MKRIVHFLGLLAVPAVVVLLAVAICGGVLAAKGNNPILALAGLARECFGTPYGIGQILYRTTTLTFTGLSVAIAFRAGLFNIGAEGQLYVGAFAGTLAALALKGIPAVFHIPGAIAAAVLAAGAWGGIAGFLKSKFGAHEVITTIMLNFIAAALVGYLLRPWCLPETVHTAELQSSAQIPRLSAFWGGARGSTANLSVFLALATSVAAWLFLERTVPGYELRVAGANPAAGEAAGIRSTRVTILAMCLAGGVAGLVVTNEILGGAHYFERDFSSGDGFLGIAVALLARNHPIGVLASAFVFSTISYGGLIIQDYHVPRVIADILSATVIILMIVGAKVADWLALRRQKRALAGNSQDE